MNAKPFVLLNPNWLLLEGRKSAFVSADATGTVANGFTTGGWFCIKNCNGSLPLGDLNLGVCYWFGISIKVRPSIEFTYIARVRNINTMNLSVSLQ